MLAVGAIVWLASELMFFGGLFAAYFTLRSMTDVWPPEGIELDTLPSLINTLILILSSGTMILGVRAFERGDRLAFQRWTVVTLALGAAFFVEQIREYTVLDFGVGTNAYGSIYYLLTGFHAAHVFAGLVLLATAVALARGTGPLSRHTGSVDAVSYYWHFVDVVWVAVFVTIFVIR
jgi:cytochrome c oxidase subunit III